MLFNHDKTTLRCRKSTILFLIIQMFFYFFEKKSIW